MKKHQVLCACMACLILAETALPYLGTKFSDAPKAAFGGFNGSISLTTSTSASSVNFVGGVMGNTIEGEDFSVERVSARRPAADISLKHPDQPRYDGGLFTPSPVSEERMRQLRQQLARLGLTVTTDPPKST